MSVKAIYPGSFDPPTNGHVDLIQRGAKLFEHLVVAVLRNSAKDPLFTFEERVEMLQEATSGIKNVSVATFNGLMPRAVPERLQNRGGSLHAQIAGQQRRLKIFERRLVHRAGQRHKVFNLG